MTTGYDAADWGLLLFVGSFCVLLVVYLIVLWLMTRKPPDDHYRDENW